MQIPILIEPISDSRFRATGGGPFGDSAEADSPEAALAAMRQLIRDRIAHGARIETVDLLEGANPWLSGAGMFKGDPLYDQWQQAIADYRKEVDAADHLP